MTAEMQILPDEAIISKIYILRGKKVMVDRDLAVLYGVETRVLNQAVRRNHKRFPDDFMFQMTEKEMLDWKSQIVISNSEKMGLRKPPMVFTEQGVTMLSSVLHSETAIMVNIAIIRVFNKMRELINSHREILQKLELLEKSDIEQNDKIRVIFEYLRQIEKARQKQFDFKNRTRIGFKP